MNINNIPSNFMRLGAILYDIILLASIFILATFIYLAFNHFEIIEPGNIYFRIYLLIISYGFFVYFWTRYGQTTGMVAWKLKVVNKNGNKLNIFNSSLRFILALISISFFGIGLLWIFLNKEKQSLYDIFAKTKLILVEKK